MSLTSTTGEFDPGCYECNPSAFENDPRPRVLMSLCQHHFSLLEPISDEEIVSAYEQGRKDREAVEQHQPAFVPPRGYFR